MNSLKHWSMAIALMTCIGCSHNDLNQPNTYSTSKPSQFDDERFESELAAVEAASNKFNPISIDEGREFMGSILRRVRSDGRFEYLYTVARGDRGADSVNMHLAVPYGLEVMAFWHTHGAAHYSRKYFSDTDSNLVRRMAVPFYLADHTGNLRVLRPGDFHMTVAQSNRLGLGASTGFAKGNSVYRNKKEKVMVATTRVGIFG